MNITGHSGWEGECLHARAQHSSLQTGFGCIAFQARVVGAHGVDQAVLIGGRARVTQSGGGDASKTRFCEEQPLRMGADRVLALVQVHSLPALHSIPVKDDAHGGCWGGAAGRGVDTHVHGARGGEGAGQQVGAAGELLEEKLPRVGGGVRHGDLAGDGCADQPKFGDADGVPAFAKSESNLRGGAIGDGEAHGAVRLQPLRPGLSVGCEGGGDGTTGGSDFNLLRSVCLHRVRINVYPLSLLRSGRRVPGRGEVPVNRSGRGPSGLHPAKTRGIGGGGRHRHPAPMLRHRGERPHGRVVFDGIMHVRTLVQVSQCRAGCGGDGTIVARRQLWSVGDHLGVGISQLVGGFCGMLLRECRQHSHRLAPASHPRRTVRGHAHPRVPIDLHNVHLAKRVDGKPRLPRATAQPFGIAAGQIMANCHHTHTELCRRLKRGLRIHRIRGERSHQTIKPADRLGFHKRNSIPHHPRHRQQRLQRLIARPPPGLPRKLRTRNDQRARVGGVAV